MSQSISVRREGDLIVIEDREETPDHKGVLKATYLTLPDAIALFKAGLSLAWAPEGTTTVPPAHKAY